MVPLDFEAPVPAEGDYFRWLRTIEPESLRRAWLEGDFHALQGSYFKDFRPEGPHQGEEDWAWHVYSPDPSHPRFQRIESWWPCWIGMDWGYIHPTVFNYNRKSPEGRIYTTREVSVSRVEPYELGVMLGHDARPIIDGLESKRIVVYISPDTKAKEHSETTESMQIVAGVNQALGPNSAFLLDFDESERQMKPEDAFVSMMNRRDEQKKARLIFAYASNNRVAGFMHMQTLLRFRALDTQSMPDMEYASKLFDSFGIVAQRDYLNQPEFTRPREVLPKWRISNVCTGLIKSLGMAVHKPGTNDVLKWNATESSIGDDHIDAIRYATLSEERQSAGDPPLDTRISDRMKQFSGSGYSDHTRHMALQQIRYNETVKPKDKGYTGHNRMAVMRAMLNQKARDLVSRAGGRIN